MDWSNINGYRSILEVLCDCRDDDNDDDDDGKSEASLTSQNSYDPLHPNFHNKDGEIGSQVKDDQPSDVVLLTHRPRPDTGLNHTQLHSRLTIVTGQVMGVHMSCQCFQLTS